MPTSKRKCALCGERFPREDGLVSGLSFFCSTEHQILFANKPRFKKRAKPVPKDVYEQVAERDKTCRFCGTRRDIHAHHILYRSEGGGHIPKNMILLCEEHHSLVHSDKKVYQEKCLELIDSSFEEARGEQDEDREA